LVRAFALPDASAITVPAHINDFPAFLNAKFSKLKNPNRFSRNPAIKAIVETHCRGKKPSHISKL
jgi:hypothetical protein